MEGEQKRALRQGESIQAHLEQKRVELMKTADKMKKLSKSKSDVDFLKVQCLSEKYTPLKIRGIKKYPVLSENEPRIMTLIPPFYILCVALFCNVQGYFCDKTFEIVAQK